MKIEALIEVCMTDLADMVSREIRDKGWSLREAEEHMKVSRSALGNMINDKDIVPAMETLEKLATYFKLPLWRVIEMAGIDLGLPRTPSDLAQQLTSLAGRMPEIEPIVGFLLKLYPDDLRGVVAYLETLDRLRGGDPPKDE